MQASTKTKVYIEFFGVFCLRDEKKLEPALAEAVPQALDKLKALSNDESLKDTSSHSIGDLHCSSKKKLEALLTPEEFKKLDSLKLKEILLFDDSIEPEGLKLLLDNYELNFIGRIPSVLDLYLGTKLFKDCVGEEGLKIVHLGDESKVATAGSYFVVDDAVACKNRHQTIDPRTQIVQVTTRFHGLKKDIEIESNRLKHQVDVIARINALKQLPGKLESMDILRKNPDLWKKEVYRIGVMFEPRKSRKISHDQDMLLDDYPFFYQVAILETEKDYDYDCIIYKIKDDKEYEELLRIQEEQKKKGNPIVFSNNVKTYPMFRDRDLGMDYLGKLVDSENFKKRVAEFRKTHADMKERKLVIPRSYVIHSGKETQEVSFVKLIPSRL